LLLHQGCLDLFQMHGESIVLLAQPFYWP